MDIKRKLAAGLAAVAAVGALGVGTAAAAARHAAPVPARSAPAVATADRDAIQQGDQTTPDSTGSKEVKDSKQTASEQPGAENENASETEQPDDGPGGHADPNGTVDHQFQGVE